MANTNSDLATAQAAAQRTPASAPKPGLTSGIMWYLRGKVTCPATPTVNDTLTLIPAELIPINAVPVPEESWVFCETDPGTALNLDVGTPSDPDFWADDLALTTAGPGYANGKVCFERSGTLPLGVSTPAAITAQEAILATVKTSTAVVQTVIHFQMAFRIIG